MILISYSYHNRESFDKLFNSRSNFMSELWARKLNARKFKIPKVKKVAVSLVKDKTNVLIYDYQGVLEIETDFHFLDSSYEAAMSSKYERFRILFNAFICIAEKYEIDKTIFEEVYRECIEEKLINQYYIGKRVFSDDKKYFAALLCVHEEDAFIFVVDIFDSKTNAIVKRQEIKETKPFRVSYRDYLVQIKFDNGFYTLQPNGEHPTIYVSLPSDEN